jgi:hypothetical protein
MLPFGYALSSPQGVAEGLMFPGFEEYRPLGISADLVDASPAVSWTARRPWRRR